jgi:hypothetical protein
MTMFSVSQINTNSSTPVSPTEDAWQNGSPDGESLLPDPVQLAFTGDVGAQIAALAVQAGGVEQRDDETERDALESLRERRGDDQVREMRAKAGAILGAALVQGLGTALKGGAEIAGGAASLNDVTCSVSGKVVAPGTFLGATSPTWAGAGDIASAMGNIGSGVCQAEGANHDADATAAQNDAQRLLNSSQNVHDDSTSAIQLIAAAMQFFQEYAQTQAQTRNAVLHGA